METPTLLEILASMEQTIEELNLINESLRSRIKELEDEIIFLSKENTIKADIIKSKEVEIEYLTISHIIAENPDSLIETRRKIARLISNIDTCISMLKD